MVFVRDRTAKLRDATRRPLRSENNTSRLVLCRVPARGNVWTVSRYGVELNCSSYPLLVFCDFAIINHSWKKKKKKKEKNLNGDIKSDAILKIFFCFSSDLNQRISYDAMLVRYSRGVRYSVTRCHCCENYNDIAPLVREFFNLSFYAELSYSNFSSG